MLEGSKLTANALDRIGGFGSTLAETIRRDGVAPLENPLKYFNDNEQRLSHAGVSGIIAGAFAVILAIPSGGASLAVFAQAFAVYAATDYTLTSYAGVEIRDGAKEQLVRAGLNPKVANYIVDQVAYTIVAGVYSSAFAPISSPQTSGVQKSTNVNSKSTLSYTEHGLDQKITRGVRSADVLDAYKKPLEVRPVKIDDLGRPSQRFIGSRAEVAINPETNKIVSVNPTSSAKVARILRKLASSDN